MSKYELQQEGDVLFIICSGYAAKWDIFILTDFPLMLFQNVLCLENY